MTRCVLEKHVRPVGRGHFAKFLQQIEMPRGFIGNAELIEAAATTSSPRKHGLLRSDNAISEAITLERHANASGSRHGVTSSSSDSSLFLSESPEDEDADKNREKEEDKIKSRRNKQQSGRGHSPSIIKKKRNTERFVRVKMRKFRNIYHNIAHPASHLNERNLARTVRDRRVAKKNILP